MKGFKILLAKAYLDKGWSLTSYVKYAVALFAVRVTNIKLGILVGLIYVASCYFIGKWFYRYNFIETENEIQNIFNPFQQEMRNHIKKKDL